jgi:phosphoglycolate phosphatase-like HAD superfamily hydrolase
MVKAVILDFDDTIVQTSRFRRGLLEATLQDWTGLSNDKIVLDWGQPFRSIVKTFVGIENLENFIQHYKCAMGKKPIEPCMGAERLLQRLRQRQVPVGILSSSIRELIEFDLKELGFLDKIARIFDSEIVKNPKPSPRALQLPIEWLKKEYSIRPTQCIYVGDSIADMQCSVGQLDFFAVLSGMASWQDFINKGLPPDRIVENLDDLRHILFE